MNVEGITIISKQNTYNVDNIYYYGPFLIGLCFILLLGLIAILFRKSGMPVFAIFIACIVSIFIGSIICSYKLSTENMEVVFTTYEFETRSDEALKTIEMLYGKTPVYNEETKTYTITIKEE